MVTPQNFNVIAMELVGEVTWFNSTLKKKKQNMAVVTDIVFF